MSALAWVFWASMAGAGWVLVGYPLALRALPSRPWRRAEGEPPTVSIVVPGYRERETLPAKLRALAELEYPPGLIEVLVPIDGDRELARLAQEAWPAATVLYTAERPAFLAKNRYGLPDVLPLDWQAFAAAMPQP